MLIILAHWRAKIIVVIERSLTESSFSYNCLYICNIMATTQQNFNLLEKYLSKGDKYAQTIMTIHGSIGDDIFPLLKRAEKEGKKLDIKESSQLHDEYVLSDIILV